MLVDGVRWSIAARRLHRRRAGRVIDFDKPENNDWLAVNQFTVAEGSTTAGPTWCCSSTACRWP